MSKVGMQDWVRTGWIAVMCTLTACFFAAPADAQVVGGDQTGGTGGQQDLQDLLDQAGLGGNTGTTGTGTTDTTGGFQDNTAGPAPTGTGRTPIIQDNFTAHRGSALAGRRPGLQIQQAISVHTGTANFFTNSQPVDSMNFFRFAFEQIIRTIIDGINQNMGLNLFGTNLGGLFNGTGGLGNLGTMSPTLPGISNDPQQTPNQQGNLTSIDNATTTGQGTMTVIE